MWRHKPHPYDMRFFPMSQKDKDVLNINEVKERKRLDDERKRLLRKQKEQEFREKKQLKKFDYDVRELEQEPDTEEDGFSDQDDLDMGDS